jgi:hypothetical protein
VFYTETGSSSGYARLVAGPFSVDDAFTVGVSFDLLGGFLLGRGLLASLGQIAQRTGDRKSRRNGRRSRERA